jgi:FAD:protein FMN transferase
MNLLGKAFDGACAGRSVDKWVQEPAALPLAPMSRRGLMVCLGVGTSIGCAAPWRMARATSAPARSSWHETAMLAFGTTVWLRAAHTEAPRARAALDAATATIARIESHLSLFRSDSEIVRLNRDGAIDEPSSDMLEVLARARSVSQRSAGAFDVTVQPLWSAWQDARARGRRPSVEEIERARSKVNWRGVRASSRRVEFAQPGMAITLNGIAQGYAADAVRDVLHQHGIEHALVDTGEWWPLGRADDGKAWRLGLEDSRRAVGSTRPAATETLSMQPDRIEAVFATLIADGRAVACASDDKMAFDDQRRDHHIFDPRTGRSPRHLAKVIVAASTATWADALTKPLMMGTAARALSLARAWGVDALVVDKHGRWQASAGLNLERAQHKATTAASKPT